MKKILFYLSAAVLLFGCGGPSRIAELERSIEAFRDSVRNTGLAVAVVKDNRLIYSRGFGLADLETGRPVTDSTLFRIASISKSFSATAILQLIEAGKLSLSDDASALAGFPVRNPKWPDTVITLEMLLSHTSSLNDSQGYFTFDGINPESNPDWAKCYNDYEPGTGYAYCNLNFNLAGSFIEKLGGERFDQYIVHHILDPLGLYGGYCVDSLDASRFAKLYSSDPDNGSVDGAMVESTAAYDPRREVLASYRSGIDTPVFSPTGGMKISAPDLARYMLVHMNYGRSPEGVRILDEALARSMQTPRSDEEHYGLALWVDEGSLVPGVRLVGHTGGAYGLRSAMFFDPEAKYGFVMMSSGTDGANDRIIPGTLRRLYDAFIR